MPLKPRVRFRRDDDYCREEKGVILEITGARPYHPYYPATYSAQPYITPLRRRLIWARLYEAGAALCVLLAPSRAPARLLSLVSIHWRTLVSSRRARIPPSHPKRSQLFPPPPPPPPPPPLYPPTNFRAHFVGRITFPTRIFASLRRREIRNPRKMSLARVVPPAATASTADALLQRKNGP